MIDEFLFAYLSVCLFKFVYLRALDPRGPPEGDYCYALRLISLGLNQLDEQHCRQRSSFQLVQKTR